MHTTTLSGRCTACGASIIANAERGQDVVTCDECGARNWRAQIAAGRQHGRRMPAAARDRRSRGSYIICPNPNCGYRGTPHTERYGSTLIAVLLLLFALLPGILYILFGMGSRTYCPTCGVQLGSSR